MFKGSNPQSIFKDNSTELATNYTIIFNKGAATTVILAAIGSNRVRQIVNDGAGKVTLAGKGIDISYSNPNFYLGEQYFILYNTFNSLFFANFHSPEMVSL